MTSRVMPAISFSASSMMEKTTSRSTLGLCANTTPNSANQPRMRLMQAALGLQALTQAMHAQHALLVNRLDGHKALGREAASHMAAASLASFLPPLPCIRYGETKWAAMMRASRPIPFSLRAQWWALVATGRQFTETSVGHVRLNLEPWTLENKKPRKHQVCGAFLNNKKMLAETEGFEPSMRLYTPYSLSRGAPSATRSRFLAGGIIA